MLPPDGLCTEVSISCDNITEVIDGKTMIMKKTGEELLCSRVWQSSINRRVTGRTNFDNLAISKLTNMLSSKETVAMHFGAI